MADLWRSQVAPDWVPVLDSVASTLGDLGLFLRAERVAGHRYLPADDAILRAFTVPLERVRVVIVGQDPYPTPGDAMGLSFSVAAGRPLPRSLANIRAELLADTGERLPSGDLSRWADQGVMLLNRVLTVRSGEAGSHRGHGWERVTDAAIRALGERGGPLVAILWGRDAQSVRPLLAHASAISSVHPSPLSANKGFFGSRPFSRTNAELTRLGESPIQWGLRP